MLVAMIFRTSVFLPDSQQFLQRRGSECIERALFRYPWAPVIGPENHCRPRQVKPVAGEEVRKRILKLEPAKSRIRREIGGCSNFDSWLQDSLDCSRGFMPVV